MSDQKKTIKVKFATYIQNGYDGSVITRFFPNTEAAEKYAENDDERYNEDIQMHHLEFDEDGNLLNGD